MSNFGTFRATRLERWGSGCSRCGMQHWEFPKIRGTLCGVLIIRILLFRALY